MAKIDWNQITSKEKKAINRDKPIFIIGSREMSQDRIQNLAKKFLERTKKNILWGCLKEKYIEGLENSPQFRTLSQKLLKETLQRAAAPWTLPDSPVIARRLKSEAINPSKQSRHSKKVINKKQDYNENTIDNRIYILSYHQRDLKYVVKKLDFSLVIFINGSWHRMLHTREEFWTLMKKQMP